MTPPDWLPVLSTALRRQAADLVAEHDLPGMVVGLAAGTDQDNALAWSQGFGWGGGPSTAASSAPGSRPLDADTQFRVASITKTFTATAVVQLRDAGKLHLDDPLVQHVPEFAAVESPFGRIEDVTLRRLASHSSGLVGEPPLDHWLSLRFPTREEWLASLPGVKVAIPPGSAFKYSNLGYTLLGEVVERVSGMPYVEYMQQAVFGPLGMASTTFEPTGELAARAASGHLAHPFEDAAETAPPSPLNGMAAAGQLWTTARDLSRWLAFHCGAVAPERRSGVPVASGEEILSATSRYEMQQAVYVEPGWVGGYGFGWRILRRGDRVYHGHGGSVPGYRSQVYFDASIQAGIVVLIDGVGAADAIAAPLMDTVAQHVAAAECARPSAPPSPTPPEYRKYLGQYRMLRVGDQPARLEYRDGRLQLKDASSSPFPVAPLVTLDPTDDPAAFMVRGGRYSGELLRFSFASSGLVTGFMASGFSFIRLVDAADRP
ncbi:MAG: serine hydrolase domain-containing protein [Chloroflexota bacterium]